MIRHSPSMSLRVLRCAVAAVVICGLLIGCQAGDAVPATATPTTQPAVQATPVKAEQDAATSVQQRLRQLGVDACDRALAGRFDGFDGDYLRAGLERSGLEREGYCACVGGRFAQGEESLLEALSAPASALLQEQLSLDLDACLPADEEEPLPDEDFAYDSGDVFMCGQALDGGIVVPGFDADEVEARLQASGRERDDLCICAARYIAAGGEPLQQQIENALNPTVAYASTLAGGIAICLE